MTRRAKKAAGHGVFQSRGDRRPDRVFLSVQGRLWAAWARRVTKRESFRTVRKGDAIDVNALRANKARLPGGERGNQGVGGP